MGSPCGLLSPKGGLRAYHVPRKYPSRLGSAPTPVARHLRWRSYEPPYLATHLLVQACQHLRLVLVTTLQRFTYINHTAQFQLPYHMMLAELRSPHGSLSRRTYILRGLLLSRELHTPRLLRTHVPVEYLLQKTGFCNRLIFIFKTATYATSCRTITLS